MAQLLHGDCLEEMKSLEDNSIDLIYCDLPYGQTSCKWDCLIDLNKFWNEVMRIKKINTPIFMTCTTKFGVSLINSAPKKCPFRYDLVWVKSAPAGFLTAKKMPMRKHEMIYVFYEKLPFYDLSSHKHKFIKEVPTKRAGKDNVDNKGMIKNRSKSGMETQTKYEPPLPVSVVKEEEHKWVKTKKDSTYGEVNTEDNKELGGHKQRYEPPLPTSLIKEEKQEGIYGELPTTDNYGESIGMKKADKHKVQYEPPLPVSIIKEEPEKKYVGKPVMRENTTYGDVISYEIKERKNGESRYEPPLPVSVVKTGDVNEEYEGNYGKIQTPDYVKNNITRNKLRREYKKNGDTESTYEPPLPTTMLEIKSTRGKHSTEKPVALTSWILKYYSNEGDVVLDATMGSGGMGVSCRDMNRNFIGIEKDDDIYEVACGRIWN